MALFGMLLTFRKYNFYFVSFFSDGPQLLMISSFFIGQGRVVSLTKPEVVGSSSKDLCYNMLPSITRISGK